MPTQIASKKIQAAQVYFPMPLYIQIKQIAAEEGKPMATWVRDTINKEIESRISKKKSWAEIPTFSWPEIDHKLSEHIDDAIYGNP